MSGLAAATVSAVLASSASAVVVHTGAGRFFGVMPRAGVTLSKAAGGALSVSPQLATVTSTGALEYHGGLVLHTTRPYLVFWDPAGTGIAAPTRELFDRYLTDTAADSAGGDDVFGVSRQYTDAAGYGAAGESFSAAQAIGDVQPYPTAANCARKPSPVTTCLTDVQIQAELVRLIAADGLPSGTGAGAPVYFVIVPATVNVCITGLECADNYFCAYHGAFADSGADVIYAPIPLLNAVKACQGDGSSQLQEPNGIAADVAIDNLSHEYNESITDPEGDAWYDDGSDNEEADYCQQYAAARDPAAGADPHAYSPTVGGYAVLGNLSNQSINGDRYYTQSEWSNGAADCELRPNRSLIPGFTGSPLAEVGVAVAFHPMPDSGTISSNTWSFGDGTSTFAVGASTVQSHVYAAAGTYTVSRTAIDGLGTVGTQSQTIAVDVPPVAAFTSSTAVAGVRTDVAFDGAASGDANPGVHIAGYDWNFGDGDGTQGSPSATHRYQRAGTYTVELMVIGSDGLITSVSHQLRVENVPQAEPQFESRYAAVGAPVRFGATVKSGTSRIVSRRWSFGDGATGGGASPRHTYRRPGRYTVKLTLVTASGLPSTGSRILTVHRAEAITRVMLTPAPGHRIRVSVAVNGPGTLVIAGQRYTLSGPGSMSCLTLLTEQQTNTLRAGKPVHLHVGVVFHPLAGRRTERTTGLTLTG